jgi:hypothetical protein
MFGKTLSTLVATTTVLGVGGLAAASSSASTTWDTTPVHVVHNVHPTPKVVDLRVGQHPTYDRVVIDFQGKLAGYDVRYVKQLHYDGTGESVPLRGNRFLQIRITPAVAHDAQGHSVYHGPQLQQYAMPMLRGAAFTGDYEGYVSFGLALSHFDTFRVLEVTNPNRLVIDVHH